MRILDKAVRAPRCGNPFTQKEGPFQTAGEESAGGEGRKEEEEGGRRGRRGKREDREEGGGEGRRKRRGLRTSPPIQVGGGDRNRSFT